ncbi:MULTISPECIES: prevent-host-death protein [unclassified Chryseobacterium]|jgi:hypothetical protein|uniref:prevent-host-death protein n=1 Tax=unclassified Chryseobacterium TaxID=2593645 RepID=UPI000D3D5D53|nr:MULTISPECIES: prevent-host-death protein [unclassified Chryseobacterium]PTT43093.1 prevent-host-death protein [Chryseobacterium sp. HMWF028]PTT77179.1 prevent-host-death protein [Chryseobacterium sp. HMWF001]PVV61809.1 prevent-host-death protein [Chryseobacterium sp. HMWF035]
MDYTLELSFQEPDSHLVFNNILFDSFKVNIVEKYTGKMSHNPRLCEVIFRVRTSDDEIIHKKDGNIITRIKEDQFNAYQKLTKAISSYEYKNKLVDRNIIEQDYVHFILSLVITNYNLS